MLYFVFIYYSCPRFISKSSEPLIAGEADPTQTVKMPWKDRLAQIGQHFEDKLQSDAQQADAQDPVKDDRKEPFRMHILYDGASQPHDPISESNYQIPDVSYEEVE